MSDGLGPWSVARRPDAVQAVPRPRKSATGPFPDRRVGRMQRVPAAPASANV